MLVLHIEKPVGYHSKKEQHREVDQKKLLPAQHQGQKAIDQQDGKVVENLRPMCPAPGLHPEHRQPVGNQQVKHGCYHKLENRGAEQPVGQFSQSGTPVVFFHRQEMDVANSPVFQLAVVPVVGIVNLGPVGIGDAAEKTAEIPEQVVPLPGF